MQIDVVCLASLLQVMAEYLVCSDTAANADSFEPSMLRGRDRFGDQAIDDGLLETGTDVGDLLIAEIEFGKVDLAGAGDGVANRRFQSAEAEIQFWVMNETAWERVGFGVAALSHLGNRRAAGIGQAEHTGDLVKGFACGVVDRAAEVFSGQRIGVAIQMGMAATNNHTDAWKYWRLGLDLASVNVGMQMIDGNQRQVCGQGQGFGRDDADQQGPRQPGGVGHGDCIQIVQFNRCRFQRLVDHGNDSLDMGSSGDLGHDSVKLPVQFILGRDDAAENLSVGVDNRCRSFIAGRFNAENSKFFGGFH